MASGESDKGALRLDLDRRVMLQFRGSAITSDAGLLAYRELDDTLSLTDTGADRLADARTGMTGGVIVRQVASGDRRGLCRCTQTSAMQPLRCLRSTASSTLLLAASANCRCSRRSKAQSSPQNRWNPTYVG